MRSESEKMRRGEWYDANNDETLLEKRMAAKDLCFDLDHIKPSHRTQREAVIQQLLGYLPPQLELLSPFMCDYGSNIHLGKNVFINSYCYFMDGADITIGDFVFIGPYCGFYTAHHAINHVRRNQGLEKALPITIGNNVWLGANVSVLPGVTIGEDCVIGAGSVVTKNIEPHSIACGNPCRVIRKVNEQDL